MLKTRFEQEEHTFKTVNWLVVEHNGKEIAREFDDGEPEDNLFIRDYSWIAPLLHKVYNLGVADGEEILKGGETGIGLKT